MRLACDLRSYILIWFLRSRGDAPRALYDIYFLREVPPLARRCARSRDAQSCASAGSSARAEMRRLPAFGRRGSDGFLRSRGDAPPEEPAPVRNPTGSSARAEMRPSRAYAASPAPRFLRSRGDAPRTGLESTLAKAVPPLARRCASSSDCGSRLKRGSSARAEMRRATLCRRGCDSRFLRSRGDAPLYRIALSAILYSRFFSEGLMQTLPPPGKAGSGTPLPTPLRV